MEDVTKKKLQANMNLAREVKLDAIAKKKSKKNPNPPGVSKRTMAGSRLVWLFKKAEEFGIVKFKEQFSDGSYVEFIRGPVPDFPDEDPEMGPESGDRARAENWSSNP